MSTWADLCRVITSPALSPASCLLGLQQTQDSLDLLHHTHTMARLARRGCGYGGVASDYVPLVGLFLRQLCQGMVSKWADDVAMEMTKSSEGNA